MRKELVFVLGILFFLSFVSSLCEEGPTIGENYFINSNVSVSRGEICFSDVLLKIASEEGVGNCKISSLYSNYELMDSFDYKVGNSYYKNLINLPDGDNKYYVKCQNLTNPTLHKPGELEVILLVNSLVTGKIQLSENSPLTSGKIEVNLETSKILSSQPTLTYSFDSKNYNPLVLNGNGDSWNGYIILNDDLGEGVLSFKMTASDLQNRAGTKILGDSVFPYDTINPPIITDIKAFSDADEIRIEWSGSEDAKEYRVYRSTSGTPDSTDFYETTENEYFYDDEILEGKTYYYRVSSVDSALNEAGLSKVVSGIAIRDYKESDTGLSPLLIGKVEGLIVEIEEIENEVLQVTSGFESLNENERNLFTRLKMFDKLAKFNRDLTSLKNSVEKYKSQDLSESELNQRIDSSRVQLGVIEKTIPSSFEILEESSFVEEVSEEFIVNALYEIDNFLSEREIEKSIKETLKVIEEKQVKIKSSFYSTKVVYIDGSYDEFFIVKKVIESQIERIPDSYFVEILPKGISESSKISVSNLDHNFISDNVLTFGSDTKEIFYFIEGDLEFKDLNSIESGFVYNYKEESNSKGITGFSVLEFGSDNYVWIGGVFFLAMIIVYFVYSKKNDYSDDYFRLLNKINDGSKLVNENKFLESKERYSSVKKLYQNLSKNEKEKVYPKVQTLYNNISINEIKETLKN
jgi:hypothetical protein